jgi:hypothetical protein
LFARLRLVLESAAGSAAMHVAVGTTGTIIAVGVGGALLLAAAGGAGAGEAVREARHVGKRAHRAARALDLANESGGPAEAAGGAASAADGGEKPGGAHCQRVYCIERRRK